MPSAEPTPYIVQMTPEFSAWVDGLTDEVATVAVASRIARIQLGLLGDHKSVGGPVSELRIHAGPGYRIYFTIRQRQIVLLLCGGSKRTQTRDIASAKRLAADLD